MGKCRTDVGPTVATNNSRLVGAEPWLDFRPENPCYVCPEAPPEAGRELEWPHARCVLSSRILEDPDEQVYGRAKHLIEGVVGEVSRVYRLCKEAGNKDDPQVVHLIWLPIVPRSAAAGIKDEAC